MTAFFFDENTISGTICNNDFSFSPVQASMFNSLVAVGRNSTSGPAMSLAIYNNSLVDAGVNAMSAAINAAGFLAGDSLILENNIASGMTNCVYAQDSGSATALSSDYNLWNCSSGQNKLVNTYYSYSQWQGQGNDTHGVLGKDPSWVAAPGNEHLSSFSPAIGRGRNLSSLGIPSLDSDAAGLARPASGAWDIGAFEFQALVTPPSGLTAVAK